MIVSLYCLYKNYHNGLVNTTNIEPIYNQYTIHGTTTIQPQYNHYLHGWNSRWYYHTTIIMLASTVIWAIILDKQRLVSWTKGWWPDEQIHCGDSMDQILPSPSKQESKHDIFDCSSVTNPRCYSPGWPMDPQTLPGSATDQVTTPICCRSTHSLL